jgi:hypothetical protein
MNIKVQPKKAPPASFSATAAVTTTTATASNVTSAAIGKSGRKRVAKKAEGSASSPFQNRSNAVNSGGKKLNFNMATPESENIFLENTN